MMNGETPCTSTHVLPVMLLFDADLVASGALEAALLRRFGGDYRVMTAASWKVGIAALSGLAERGEAAALVAVNL